MPMTMTEKILAAAAGEKEVHPGQLICKGKVPVITFF